MKTYVFLYNFMCSCEVVNENEDWYAVIDPEGVNTIVDKSLAVVRKG